MMASVTLNVHDNAEETHPPAEVRWSVLNRLCFVFGYAWAVLMTAFFATAYGLAQLIARDQNVFRFWASGWGGSLLFGFGVRVDVDVRADLDPRQPYVFAANHQNLLDIPILARTLPHPFGFVAKLELEDVPFLGIALKLSSWEGRTPGDHSKASDVRVSRFVKDDP